MFKEPVALPVDAAVAAAAAAKAAREAASAARVGTIVRARLAFEDVSGLMRAETAEALLERVQYRPSGSVAASFIISFTVDGEMYEVAYLEASLDACVAAAEPAVFGRILPSPMGEPTKNQAPPRPPPTWSLDTSSHAQIWNFLA